MTLWKKYVLWFAQEHVDFRLAEIQSIVKLLNIPIKYSKYHNEKHPFWLVELPNDLSAKQIASRSISLRYILELWSSSRQYDKFHKKAQTFIVENENYVTNLCKTENSFRITVETYNRHLTQKEKIDKIETFHYLPAKGPVNLRNPDICWYYIEYYGLDTVNPPEQPLNIIFGKWLADGQRSLLREISLKTRKFIGNTSMDPQLSVLMANQALVSPGDIIMDPFVGSGSLLVPPAKFGAFVMGGDIDFMMLHARTRPSRITQKVREKDESIRANLKQYNCDNFYVDVVVSDFSKEIWHRNLQFDSIITDPPYGIREATEKVESKQRRTENYTKEQNNDQEHFPSTSQYRLCELYSDLLNFAAKHLKLNGRLVCWVPIIKNDYDEQITIPKNKHLQLIANCEQDISMFTSRRLVTYEKICEPCELDDDKCVDEVLKRKSSFVQESVGDFRTKFFDYNEETRQVRRMRKAELKEIGRQEALNRGKRLDENGKVTTKPI